MVKTKYFDSIIIIVFLVIAAFSGKKVFFETFSSTFSAPKTDSLALLKNNTNTVKKKPDGTLVWIDGTNGDELYSNDLIYTHDESTSDISFLDGTEITLAENTLFKISRISGETTLDIEKGQFFAKLSKDANPLKLTMKGQEYFLSGSDAEIQIKQDGKKQEISVLKGNVKLKSKEKTQKLVQNQQLKVEAGKTEIKTLTILLDRPANNSTTYFSNEKANIRFKWNSSENVDDYKIIVSKRSSLSRPIITENINTSNFEYELEEGQYYWQVSAKNQDNVDESPIGFFRVVKLLPPKPLTPLAESSFTFPSSSKKNDIQLNFKWENKSEEVHQTELIIEGDNDLKETISENSYTWNNPPEGQYNWKVREIKKDGTKTPYSEPLNFSITKIYPPAPPKLSFPIDEKEISLFELSKSELINFEWEKIEGVKEYEITLKDAKNEIIFQKTTELTKASWIIERFGNFTWTVRSIDEYQRETESADERELTITKLTTEDYTPGDGTKIQLKKPNQKVSFEWSKIEEDDETFMFELSTTEDFSGEIHKKKIKGTDIELNIPKVGTYYWRTSKLLENNAVIYSPPKKVTVEPSPPPKTPTLAPEVEVEIEIKGSSIFRDKLKKYAIEIFNFIFPAANANQVEKEVTIQWQDNSDAKEFVIEIYADETLQKKLVSEKTKEPKYIWKNPEAGTYHWRIAIFDFWGRQTEFSNLSKLIIKLPEDYLELQSVYPLLPTHESKHEYYPWKKIFFKWKEDSVAVRNRLLIYTDEKLSNLVFDEETEDTELEVEIEKLKPNTQYYWRVYSYGKYKQRKRGPVIKFSTTEVEDTPEKEQRPSPSFLLVGTTPGLFSSEGTLSTVNTDISGFIQSSYYLQYHYAFKEKYNLTFFANRDSGKVFTNLDYEQITLEARIGRIYKFFNKSIRLQLVVSNDSLTTYNLNSANSLSPKDKTFLSYGIQGNWKQGIEDDSGWHFNLAILTGGGLRLRSQLDYRILFGSRLFLNTGLNIELKKYDDSDGDYTNSEQKVNLGLGLFL